VNNLEAGTYFYYSTLWIIVYNISFEAATASTNGFHTPMMDSV